MSKRLIITGLAGILAVFVIACGSKPEDPKTVTPAAAGSAGAVSAAAAAGGADTQAGPQKLTVGQPGNLQTRDGSGTVTVASVKVQGKSIVAAVTITCTAGQVSYNPFDWAALAGDGTKLDVAFDVNVKNQLSSGQIGAGQKITGNLVFEGTAAQAKGAQIQLTVGFETAAYWVNP